MFCRLPVNPWPHLPFWSPEWTKRWLWPHMSLGEMSCEDIQWDEQKVQVRSLRSQHLVLTVEEIWSPNPLYQMKEVVKVN